MITAEKVGIESSICFETVYNMEMSIKPNEHGKLILQGILAPQAAEQGENWDNSQIRVVMLDEHGKPRETLFHGILQDSYVYHENGVCEVIVTALSGSCVLDKESVSRTFQDVQVTYGSLIRQKASDAHGSVQMHAADTGSIQKPVIQYEETDWEFCRRMASHMGVPLYCDVSVTNPALQIGLREEAKTVAALGPDYRVCVRPNITGGRLPISYEFTSYDNYEIGDMVETPSGRQSIYEKSARLENGELSFTYRMCYPKDIHMEPWFNSRIAGVTLEGEVSKTEGENVYVKFDIDGGEGKASYPFPWTPVSGNIMYSMPEQGTKVGVYFGNKQEMAACATACIRHQEPQEEDGKKKLQTPMGKKVQLSPGQFILSAQVGSGRKLALELLDAGKLNLQSPRSLALYSRGPIRFTAPSITVRTPTELYVTRTSQEGRRGHLGVTGSRNPATGGGATVLSMGQEFNFVSEQGALYGTDHICYKAFEDAPTQLPAHTFSWGLLAFNIIAGVLAVAAVACIAGALASAVFTGGAAAGVAAFIVKAAVWALGGLALGAKAGSDIQNQTNSNLGEYVYVGARGAAAGGFAGFTIVGAFYLAPMLAREVILSLPENWPVTLNTIKWIMGGAYAVTEGTAGLNLMLRTSNVMETASGNNPIKGLLCDMLGVQAGQDTYEFLDMMTSAFSCYMIASGASISQAQASKPGSITERANSVQRLTEQEGAGGSNTGTVWDNIKATQENYPNTNIPRSFEIEVNGQRMWVHGNATEHLYEDVNAQILAGEGWAHNNPDLYTQELLSDFYGSLEQAIASGIKYGELTPVGNWEFIFAAPRQEGLLPAIIHAQFNGW